MLFITTTTTIVKVDDFVYNNILGTINYNTYSN